ncbi:MAG: hypothetical protein DMG05_02725 [Acidobacteria bacterium]|nr:MAG: hypothetical protein DMG05_02725 [Acidobacteriota bacterium]
MVVRYVDRKASFVLVILVATVNLLVRPPSLELAVGFSLRIAHHHRKYAVIVATPDGRDIKGEALL